MRNAFLTSALLAVLLMAPVAHADEAPKPDDQVGFDLSAEDWVTTKTARVTVNVEAAVSGSSASSTRGDMIKAVNTLASGDWRLISFNRFQDQTGLERWSASFEARIPEANLGGLNETAKKQSKAGMQLAIANIDFSPTLDEVEAVRASIRTQLYKKAGEQLTALNQALPGRNYRISTIEFGGAMPVPMMQPMMMKAQMAGVANDASMANEGVERSEKIRVSARVVLSALPATDKH